MSDRFGLLIKKIKKFFCSGYLYLVVLCLPLLFLNIKSSHDWGDDFAAYIHQAKNITEGISQSATGYVMNTDNPKLGPPAYPVGFPLILAPVYYFCGNNIKIFTFYLSLLLLISALLMYRFFKFYFTPLTSFFMVLIIVYNPWTLNFKMEVMSEIPFTILLLLILILYKFKKKGKGNFFYILIGILAGFLMSVRFAGIVFLTAVMAEITYSLYLLFNKKITAGSFKKTVLEKLLIVFTGFLFYFLLNVIIFKIPSSGFLHYVSVLTFDSFTQLIRDNIAYYFLVFRGFFNTENKDWLFLPVYTQCAMLTFAVIGFIKKIFLKFDFIDLVVLFYFLLILVWPYSNSGFRFLLPIAPMLLYYALTAVKDIKISFSFMKRKQVIIAMGLLILLQYKVSFDKIMDEQKNINRGPQDPCAIEAFDNIKNNVPGNALIEFEKPRALALYTGRKGFHIKINKPMADIGNNLKSAGVTHILRCNEPIDFLQDDSLKLFLIKDSSSLLPLWENSKFKLFEITGK